MKDSKTIESVEFLITYSFPASEKPSFAYDIHLHYPLVFHNVLPFPVHMTVPEEKTIESGDDITLQLITGHKLKLWVG